MCLLVWSETAQEMALERAAPCLWQVSGAIRVRSGHENCFLPISVLIKALPLAARVGKDINRASSQPPGGQEAEEEAEDAEEFWQRGTCAAGAGVSSLQLTPRGQVIQGMARLRVRDARCPWKRRGEWRGTRRAINGALISSLITARPAGGLQGDVMD